MRPSKGPVEKKRKKEPTIFFFTSDWAVALNALLPTGWHALFSSSGTEKKKETGKKSKSRGLWGRKRGLDPLRISREVCRWVLGRAVVFWASGMERRKTKWKKEAEPEERGRGPTLSLHALVR